MSPVHNSGLHSGHSTPSPTSSQHDSSSSDEFGQALTPHNAPAHGQTAHASAASPSYPGFHPQSPSPLPGRVTATHASSTPPASHAALGGPHAASPGAMPHGAMQYMQSSLGTPSAPPPRTRPVGDSGASIADMRRPGWKQPAKNLKRKGMDLAHRTDYHDLKTGTQAYMDGSMSAKRYRRAYGRLVRSDPPAKAAMDKFLDSPTKENAEEHLKYLNSTRSNLRPGDKKTNRAIGNRQDVNTQPSRTDAGRRSPTPESEGQLVDRTRAGLPTGFYAPGGHIRSSTTPLGEPFDSSDLARTMGRHGVNLGFTTRGNTLTMSNLDPYESESDSGHHSD